MAYFPGDRPAEDALIEPARGVDGFDVATATLINAETGQPVESSGFLATIEAGGVVVEWPGETVLTTPGRYVLQVTLENTTSGARELAALQTVIVERTDGWASLTYAREQWVAAVDMDDSMLWEVLEVARTNVIAYAPKLADGARPPLNYLRGQLMHARDLWNAASASPSGGFGEDGGGFAVVPRPLDWMVKQVLRPKRGIPAIA